MSLSWLIKNFVAAFFLPPLNGLLLLALAGIFRRRRCIFWTFGVSGIVLLVALSLKPVNALLLQPLEPAFVPIASGHGAGAIVVLGAGRYRNAPEYHGDTVSETALVRVRYGARLARETGLPLLVSGGAPDGGGMSEAEVMAEVLEREFQVRVRWKEASSDDTAENAVSSARILRAAGIRRILLVTHAFHMPRAQAAFERAGLEIVPAPTAFSRPLNYALPINWLPGDYRAARIALHEWIGILWYRLRSQ